MRRSCKHAARYAQHRPRKSNKIGKMFGQCRPTPCPCQEPRAAMERVSEPPRTDTRVLREGDGGGTGTRRKESRSACYGKLHLALAADLHRLVRSAARCHPRRSRGAWRKKRSVVTNLVNAGAGGNSSYVAGLGNFPPDAPHEFFGDSPCHEVRSLRRL
jgi:hypothetical protein